MWPRNLRAWGWISAGMLLAFGLVIFLAGWIDGEVCLINGLCWMSAREQAGALSLGGIFIGGAIAVFAALLKSDRQDTQSTEPQAPFQTTPEVVVLTDLQRDSLERNILMALLGLVAGFVILGGFRSCRPGTGPLIDVPPQTPTAAAIVVPTSTPAPWERNLAVEFAEYWMSTLNPPASETFSKLLIDKLGRTRPADEDVWTTMSGVCFDIAIEANLDGSYDALDPLADERDTSLINQCGVDTLCMFNSWYAARGTKEDIRCSG